MKPRQWCRSLQIVVLLLCGRLAHTATDSGATSPSSTTPSPSTATHDEVGWSPSSATPAPGTEGSTGVGSTLNPATETTVDPSLDPTANSTVDPSAATNMTAKEAPTAATELPAVTTSQPLVTSEGCLCDLTPDFCDIGCCCDLVDCGIADLSTVFSGCPQKAISGVCIEKWLMFRANVETSLVTVTDSMFCIRTEDKPRPSLPAVLKHPAVGDSYHFSPPAPTSRRYSRDFYRVDDVIQTYYTGSSVRGFLGQPSPGATAAFCVNRNPAKFLRSVSLSCTRVVTGQSCSTDPTLTARSYFTDLSVLKIPVDETVQVLPLLVPVTPLADWPAPSEHNNSCVNVAKKVEFVIGYTGRGEIMYATVNVVLADVDLNQHLMQTHSVQFQLATPSPSAGDTLPTVGLRAGSIVFGRFDEGVKPLTTLGVSESGECSSDPSRRAPVLFTHNAIAGCTFRPPSSNCTDLRSHMYGVLEGLATPDLIAMDWGSDPDWARVITEDCPDSPQESCESGCVLPVSLSIRVLWARQGLLDLPQNYILGAKYVFKCQNMCPLPSQLALTTEVTFVDTTVYPEPPRGSPQPQWKFPFGFFSRGAAELDGALVISGSEKKVTWSLMLFTATLLTGLELCTR